MSETEANVRIDREAGHEDVLSLLRSAARHPHKGPNDTDASMLLEAAQRLRSGYEPGGSWTKQTVARVIELVASLIEDAPAPAGDSGGERGAAPAAADDAGRP